MYYFKKLIDDNYSYYASPKMPRNMDGMIAISQDEYDKVLAELLGQDVNGLDAPKEEQN